MKIKKIAHKFYFRKFQKLPIWKIPKISDLERLKKVQFG